MKKLLSLVTLLLFLTINYSLFTVNCFASEQNIFGLHLTQPSDIVQAKDVINSSGGDWGWATIVIRLDLLDHNTWQDFMDKCRREHIIPIVRLGTIMENGYWKKPENSDIDNITSFLNGLNWPTTKRHVILFNEINHATEWGGGVDIKNYADAATYAAQKLHQLSPDFVVMGAALDLAAPDKDNLYASAPTVYKAIYDYKPEYFNQLDALASHSYPNHGFIASPNESGQHSIRGYDWELSYLKSLGVTKDYPVFITETGWPHREGEHKDNSFYTARTSSEYLAKAMGIWSGDSRVLAITPFIYNYPYEPFDHFSWLTKDGQVYPEYQQILNLPKKQNHPEQLTRYELVNVSLPLLIFRNNEYESSITLKNTGQSIWGETKFCLPPKTSADISTQEICVGDQTVEPGQSQRIIFKFHINDAVVDKTFIGWDDLDTKAIEPIILKGQIYHPKTGLKDRIVDFVFNIFH